MNFDEAIPAFNMGHMVPYDQIVNIISHDQRICYTCRCRLSRYNSEKRCSPCRDKERSINLICLDNILNQETA